MRGFLLGLDTAAHPLLSHPQPALAALGQGRRGAGECVVGAWWRRGALGGNREMRNPRAWDAALPWGQTSPAPRLADLWPQPRLLLPLPSVPWPGRPAAEAGILHAVPGGVGKQAAVEPGSRSDWFPSAPGAGTDVRARSPNRFCPVPADLTLLCTVLRSEGWLCRSCDPSPALQRPMDGKTSPVRQGQLLQLWPC